MASMTLHNKLEDICPFFYRLYILLGEQANVAPTAQGAIELPNHAKIYTTHLRDFVDDFFGEANLTHTTAYKNHEADRCTLLDSGKFFQHFLLLYECALPVLNHFCLNSTSQAIRFYFCLREIPIVVVQHLTVPFFIESFICSLLERLPLTSTF